MNQLVRLMSYGRKYWPQILLSVVLMALAGAAQGTVPLLIQPVFDRVLKATAPEGPIPLLPHPFLGRQIYLEDLVPIHNHGSAWFMIGDGPAASLLHRQRDLRLSRQLPGQLRRIRKCHAIAQRRLR